MARVVEAAQHAGGCAPVGEVEVRGAVAAIGAGHRAASVARLEQAAARAVAVEGDAAQFAGQLGLVVQLVFGGQAAEGAVLLGGDVLIHPRGGNRGAGDRIALVALAQDGDVCGIGAVAEVARQGQPVLLVRAAEARVPAAIVADVDAQRAGRLGARLGRRGLGDQIDDPARTLGAVGSRRIGHDLDAGVLAGWQLDQGLAATGAGQDAGRATVHQDGDIGVAAKRHIAFRVHVHRRHVSERVGQTARRRLKVVG